MRRLLVVFAVLTLLASAWFGWVYLASEHRLASARPAAPFDFPIPTDAASIAHGSHLARTRGCFGCHGERLQGAVFSDAGAWGGVAVAPNLADLARTQPPAVLEAAIRQGIAHGGRAMWSMPSYNFRNLTDPDLAALIAFLRSTPVATAVLPDAWLGWHPRILLALGRAQHMAEWAGRMPGLRHSAGADALLTQGEYIAMTTCNECHGFDLRGTPLEPNPDLAVLAAYTDGQFRHLMRTGEGINGRTDLGLMTLVARERFAHFTDAELEALLAFLRTLPGEPVDLGAPWRQLR